MGEEPECTGKPREGSVQGGRGQPNACACQERQALENVTCRFIEAAGDLNETQFTERW